MSLRDRLLLAPISNLNRKEFRESFQKVRSSDRKFFFKKIINDKYSPIFLNYVNNNQLEDLFNEEELSELKNQTKRFQIQSLEVVKEISYLNSLFNRNELTPIYLKGAALMREYSDISLRPLADIDILFEREEIFSAYQVLKENNYQGLFNNYPRKYLEKYIESNHHLPPVHRSTNITIELHHRVTRPLDFDYCPLYRQIIDNKKSLSFYNTNIYTPSINDIVVHQLVHFSLNSNFNQLLRTFSDINQIEKKYVIDWDKLYYNNKDKKIRKALSLSLEILNYNFKLTNKLNDIKKKYKDFFPTRDIVIDAIRKTFNYKREKVSKESIYKLGKAKNSINFLIIVFNKIFPPKNKINYLNGKFSKYRFNLIYYKLLIFLSRLWRYGLTVISMFIKKGSVYESFNNIKKSEDWLNS
tara:strand:- start:107 stop:1345 length:1239 start_codon:yes stop_codon:yes gene_type:complete